MLLVAHAELFNKPKPALPFNSRKSAHFRESIREIFRISIAKGRPIKAPFFFIFLFTIVWNSVNILVCLSAGKHIPPAGEGFSGEPQVVSCSAART